MQTNRCRTLIYIGLASLGGFLLARQIVRALRDRDPIAQANDLVDRCRSKINEIESALSTVASVIQQAPTKAA